MISKFVLRSTRFLKLHKIMCARIVGSLTSIPERIFFIEKVINSILNQTRPLDMVYINIPYRSLKGKEYILPEFLSRKNIKILRCSDYGPITKLIPVLDAESDPDTYIVTFDDDRIIDKNTVKIIEEKISFYPNAALSFSGWNIGSFPFYFECFYDNSQDIEVDWIQGCHSITYRRNMLNKHMLLTAFLQGPSFIKKHDDHRISGYLERKHIKKICIGKDAKKYFKPSECCNLEAISGGNSILKSSRFYIEVIYIVDYFSDLGLYHRNYETIYKTVTFKILISLLCIFILIFIVKKFGKNLFR